MMMTECGLVPLKGIILGISVPLTKSKKVCPSTVPTYVSIAKIPVEVNAAMLLTLFPRISKRCVTGVIPRMA